MNLKKITSAVLAATIAIFALATCAVVASRPSHAADNDPPAANATVPVYGPDRQVAAFRTALGPADSTSVATLTSTTTGQFRVNGRQTLTVGARFDDAAQTCKVRILYEYSTTPTKLDLTAIPFDISPPFTLTASSYTDSAGKFMAPSVSFDSEGATHVYLILDTGPTTHQVALWFGDR